jgi:uncharacterized membrane protein (DUF4010 family)
VCCSWPWPQSPSGNPSELKPALIFAAVYAAVLLATAAGREFFGQGGVYAVAVLSGLTDMDAITLSITRMVNSEEISPDTAWRCILVASMSNLVFKAAIVAFIGDRQLFGRIAVSFSVALAVGVLLLLFWSKQSFRG